MGQSIVGAAAGAPLPVQAEPGGFFICDVPWAVPKDDMASMEHPLFTLATRPDRRILRYAHGEAAIEVTPSVKGLATIHDKDVLIYCISQLMAAVNAGRAVAPTLHLKAHDLMAATGRETSGDGYRRLREAFERLSGTRIVTNIETGGIEATRGFGLIDGWEILRKARGGRMILVTVTLSDWIYRSVLSRSVLTLLAGLLPAAKAARAAGLRDRAQALRAAGGVEDRARDAAEEVGLDEPAAGVPQDDPRHRRGGRAARLQPRADRGRRGAGALAGDVRRSGGGGGAPARGRRSTRGCGRWRRGSTPISSRPSGGASGPLPAGRGSGARTRPSSPSRRAAPPGASVRGRAFRARNVSRSARGVCRGGREAGREVSGSIERRTRS